MAMESPFGVIKMFWNYIEVMIVQHCESAKSQ